MKERLIGLICAVWLFAGCSGEMQDSVQLQKSQAEEIKENEAKADYLFVYIEQLTDASMVVVPPATDPTASYPAYVIEFGERTTVEGTKQKTDELQVGDGVAVWVDQKGHGPETAEKIVVLE